MPKSLLLAAVALLVTGGLPAQAQNYSRNSVYVELGGNGLLYSVNYDRRFTDHFGGRAGFMIFGGESDELTDDQVSIAILPVMANYLVGLGSHRLELGVGLLFGVAGADTENFGTASTAGIGGVTTTFGYRYQPTGGGFLFRAGLTPFYSDGRPQLWGGVSVGYSF
jgi:hypothetical protein